MSQTVPAPTSARIWLGIALLAVLAAAANATKAVHIDDTAYLEIARAIRRDPLHAMRAELSWQSRREPIHAVNQPHLFFYPLTLAMLIVGDDSDTADIVFHLIESAFT